MQQFQYQEGESIMPEPLKGKVDIDGFAKIYEKNNLYELWG